MKWISERDALIAQTMAFVQSVTGKKGDFHPPESPTAAPDVPVGTVTVETVGRDRGTFWRSRSSRRQSRSPRPS